ncbi:unnamed protein product [Amoebophrya sp. A25]|nr:unnamed protein product [Amoebophrya sp. A25]|eukprot:GSA25T00008298001.1
MQVGDSESNTFQGGSWNFGFLGCNFGGNTARSTSDAEGLRSILAPPPTPGAPPLGQNDLQKNRDGQQPHVAEKVELLDNAVHIMQGGKVTVVAKTPIAAEKPFIGFQDDKYYLLVPAVLRNHIGVTWSPGTTAPLRIPFSRVFVAEPNMPNVAQKINAALSHTGYAILTPGIYQLEESLVVSKPNSVLMGIGYATLVAPPSKRSPLSRSTSRTASSGSSLHSIQVDPCLIVTESARGSRVGQFLMQPAPPHSDPNTVYSGLSLVQVGDQTRPISAGPSDAETPIFLYDLFARVGGDSDSSKASPAMGARLSELFDAHHNGDGRTSGNAGAQGVASSLDGLETMITIMASNIVLDHAWLWRADHDLGGAVRGLANPVHTGLQVYGNDVTVYGLAVEHHLGDQVYWLGDRGRVYFFQCEFPYDVPPAYADRHVGYRVAPTVLSHEARALGLYAFFRDYPTQVKTAILTTDNSNALGSAEPPLLVPIHFEYGTNDRTSMEMEADTEDRIWIMTPTYNRGRDGGRPHGHGDDDRGFIARLLELPSFSRSPIMDNYNITALLASTPQTQEASSEAQPSLAQVGRNVQINACIRYLGGNGGILSVVDGFGSPVFHHNAGPHYVVRTGDFIS